MEIGFQISLILTCEYVIVNTLFSKIYLTTMKGLYIIVENVKMEFQNMI